MSDGLNNAAQWIIEQLRFDRAGPEALTSDPVDWNQVIAVAQREGLVGMLLASDVADSMPPTVYRQLDEIRFQTRSYNARRRLELENWLDRFDASGISTIVLKGVALTALVYERSALRPMSDVDVLVRREDFDRAGDLLRADGFLPHREVTRSDERALRTQVGWVRQEPPNDSLDLHWHLVDSGYYARHVPIQWFWDHTINVPFGKRDMRVFTPEAQLLHMAAHFELHHAGRNLLGLYDVAALLHKFGDAMDWDLALDTAKRFEWGESLRAAVERAQMTFNVAVSDSVNARLASLRATRRERLARVLAEPDAHQAAFLFDGLDQGDWRRRMRYLGRSLFPAAEFMRVHGPIRNRRDLAWQYILRLGRGMYRIPRALWAGVTQLWKGGVL